MPTATAVDAVKYIQLSPKLFLVEQSVEIGQIKKSKNVSTTNHIFLFDRSGSMSGLLPELIEDLKVQLRTLKSGDTISIGWFSGEGQYRFAVKGFQILDKIGFGGIDTMLDSLNRTVGTTCFSEILMDVKSVIGELSAFGDAFAMTFFTDGYPVVSNYVRELANINSAIDAISGELSSSLFVGYGRYYNKELMADMSARCGGFLIHADKLEIFNDAFGQFVIDSVDACPKQVAKIPALPELLNFAFSLNGKSINVYTPEKGEIMFSPSRNKNNYIYYFSDKKPKGTKQTVEVYPEKVLTGLERAIYAGSYILTQRTKTDIALELLGTIGDVALIDSITNAYTIEEYGRAEMGIKKAVYSVKDRFLMGQDEDYVPKEDAFSLLDLFDILIADETAMFYPYQMDYNRIGRKQEAKAGFAKFSPDKDAGSPLSTLIWNDTKMNLSIQCSIPGTLPMPPEATKMGFAKEFPCNIFRNYAVVKDGSLNIPMLPVSLSDSTLVKLHDKGITAQPIQDGSSRQTIIWALDLTRLPMVNRKTARSITKATALAKLKIQECLLEAEQKAIKGAIDELKIATGPRTGTTLSAAQEKFLESIGIKKGIYSPPSDRAEATDWYFAKEFKISVKGFSSLPKLEDVRNKISAKKTLTLSEEAIRMGLDTVDTFNNMKAPARLLALEAQLTTVKTNLRKIRSQIQRVKFAVLLGKTWFDEFTSRENNTIEVDDYSVTFSVTETKVAY